MVRHHVAQAAGRVVVAPAALDADRLGHGDLHVVDVAPVPDRFEHDVPEAEDHQVLDGLLPEIMVDAVELLLAQRAAQLGVERARGLDVGAEGLLDDHAPPAAVLLDHELRRAELSDDRAEELRRRREVVEPVACGLVPRVDLGEPLGQALVGRGVVEVAVDVVAAREDPVAHGGIDLAHRVAGEVLGLLGAPAGVVHARARDGDDRDVVAEEVRGREVVERGQELALGEVPGGAEDHDRAGPHRCRERIDHARARFHGAGFRVRLGGRQRHGCPHFRAGSTWPPNCSRMAERHFSANVCSWRERKRT